MKRNTAPNIEILEISDIPEVSVDEISRERERMQVCRVTTIRKRKKKMTECPMWKRKFNIRRKVCVWKERNFQALLDSSEFKLSGSSFSVVDARWNHERVNFSSVQLTLCVRRRYVHVNERLRMGWLASLCPGSNTPAKFQPLYSQRFQQSRHSPSRLLSRIYDKGIHACVSTRKFPVHVFSARERETSAAKFAILRSVQVLVLIPKSEAEIGSYFAESDTNFICSCSQKYLDAHRQFETI